MSITPNNTHWVLIGGMNSEKSPDRFLWDILFAFVALRQVNVPENNIDIIIEPKPNSSHPILNDFFTKQKTHNTTEFPDLIQNNSLSNLMIVFNGHGNIHGLDSTNQLKPYPLITEIHNRAGLERCAVIFGQCFAGIYNYIDILKRDAEGKVCSEPTVCFIGASHLNSSISGSAGINENIRWSANIFLFHLFNWIMSPSDIDGDGNCTLTDAFKYAGAQASSHLINLKNDSVQSIQQDYKALEEIQNTLHAAEKAGESDSKLEKYKLEEASIKKSIEERLGISHTNQDPWILNANKAREFIYSNVADTD